MGQRSADEDAEPELRQYLLDWAIDFRRMIVGTQLDDKQWREYCWRETSKAVDALANGKEYRLHGHALPDGHRAWAHGPHARWILGEDDVLRVDNRPGIERIPHAQVDRRI